MSDLPRTQHIVASGLVAVVGVWVAFISYTGQPAQAFLFPRMISTVFAVLAVWTFVKALLGRSKVGAGLDWWSMRNLAPGLVIALVYIFWAARFLGFYVSSTIAFFVLLTIYDSGSHMSLASWVKRIAITAGFLAVMYGLFAKLLTVFTPRGLFF